MAEQTSPKKGQAPLAVRRELRREVHFGCPVPGCGSPYLTYHHFDPPWHVEPHHDPRKMIALCWRHHQTAEGGAYTVEQLRHLKGQPYLAGRPIRGRFDGWDQRRLVLLAGSNWFFESPYVLSIRGHVVIGLSRVGNYEGLDLDVRDAEGAPLLQMQTNDWNVETVPNDLVCGNWGNSLWVDLEDHGIRFEIRFHSFTEEKLTRFLDQSGADPGWRRDLFDAIAEWPLALCTVYGAFVWPSEVCVYPSGITGNRERSHRFANIYTGMGIDLP